MAGTSSDYLEDKIIDDLIIAATPYLAVFTVNPNFETGAGGTEATGGSYARKAITFSAASGGATANTGAVAWTDGTDIAHGTYTGWAVYDADTAGNLLFGDAYAAGRVLGVVGDVLNHAIGAITYSVT